MQSGDAQQVSRVPDLDLLISAATGKQLASPEEVNANHTAH